MFVTIVYMYGAMNGSWELNTDIMVGTALLDVLLASQIFPVVQA